jgi:nucleoside 2-deoxyribosyltransferase
MPQAPSVLVVGEVVVDVALRHEGTPSLRLGGVLHACRALWALEIPYALAYIAPSYLSTLVAEYAIAHSASAVTSIGTVVGSPNVILIQDHQEVRHQGYEHLLRDSHSCRLDKDAIQHVATCGARDAVVFPTQFDSVAVIDVLNRAGMRIHADVGNLQDPEAFLTAAGKLATLFTSTSSPHFLRVHGGRPDRLIATDLARDVEAVILKENRGGLRCVRRDGGSIEIGAQLRPAANSVGVGDAFDAAYVALASSVGVDAALAFGAWIAAEYASTTFPDDFARGVRRCRAIGAVDLTRIPGLRFPWEARRDLHVYIAAPDFDYLDTSLIDRVSDSLAYHNFTPHRPVRENGQATEASSRHERLELYQKDVELLRRCQLLVAVIERPDEGTLIELGLAAGLNIPAVVLEPNRQVPSPMLLGAPTSIVHTMDDLLEFVFSRFGSRIP